MTKRSIWLALAIASMFASAACNACKSSAHDVPEGGVAGGGECSDAKDCQGYGNLCYQSVTCTDGKCAFKLQDYGTVLPDASQIPGDCKYLACDGFGAVKAIPDDQDRPDGGPCMVIACLEGTTHTPQPQPDGTPCGTGMVCNAGNCVNPPVGGDH